MDCPFTYAPLQCTKCDIPPMKAGVSVIKLLYNAALLFVCCVNPPWVKQSLLGEMFVDDYEYGSYR